jgi:hypothetical protein
VKVYWIGRQIIIFQSNAKLSISAVKLAGEVHLESYAADPSMISLAAFVENRSFDLSLLFFTLYESGLLEQMA